MQFKIYDNNKNITRIEKNFDAVNKMFLSVLYNKYILKSKEIKQVQYKYNYTDLQTVTFIYSNNYRIVFDYIPTSHGYLEAYKL